MNIEDGEDTGDTGQKASKSSSTELPSTSSSIGIVARHVLCKPAGIPRPPVTALERLKMGPEPGRPALSAPCAYAPSVCHPEPWSSIYCPSLSQQPSTPTTYKHDTHTYQHIHPDARHHRTEWRLAHSNTTSCIAEAGTSCRCCFAAWSGADYCC